MLKLRERFGIEILGVFAAFALGSLVGCGAPPPEGPDGIEAGTVGTEGLPALAVPELDWLACGEDFPGIECALATVPLDYDRPRGMTTTLALSRVPAPDTEHKIGTVFVNPGGPGVSGVALVLGGFGDYLSALLGGRFDVVGFDPRGIAGSEPLLCFDTGAERDAFVASLPYFPYLPEQQRPFFMAGRELAGRCTADRGRRIASHMSTADVVRDLDLLRQAVGDRRLTYLGFSYGSYIGNTYANLFPHKVRALVIDGVLDPRLWSSGWQILSDRVATDQVFDEFSRLCDEAGVDCALHGPDGAAARYAGLASALKETPLEFDDGFVYSYDLLVLETAFALYSPEYWGGPDGYAALFAFLADAVLGDAGAAREASTLRAALEERRNAGSASESYDNGFEAYFGNQCADSEYPSSFAQFRATARFAEHDSRFGPFWWWNNAPCATWPTSPDRYTGPWTARTSAPVLVVGNYFDPATDYAGAVASDALLGNSRLLSYAGWGHTAFGRSGCATDYIAGYLLDGTLPPDGTVCPANPNPFVPEVTLRSFAGTPMVGLPPPIWPARK